MPAWYICLEQGAASAGRASLEQGADLHMAQLMPLPVTVSCFSKTQIDFTFLVSAHLGSPGQWAVKCACVVLCSRLISPAFECTLK